MADNNLDPKRIDELKKKLQEIERLSAKFQQNINTANFSNVVENVGAIDALFDDLIKKEQELGEETDHLVSGFLELTQKLRTTTVGIQESNKALKGLSNIAEQLSSHQKGYNDLSSKDLYNLQQKAKIETARLKRSKDILLNEREILLKKEETQRLSETELKHLDKIEKSLKNTDKLITTGNKSLANLNNQLSITYSQVKDVEKQLGLTGHTLKALSKIPLIGDAIDTKRALEAAKEAIDKGKGSFGALKAAMKSIGPDIKAVLTDPLAIAGFLGKQLYDTFISLDKGIGDFAKGMNLSYQESAKLNNEFNNMANSSGELAVTTKGISETMMAMGKAMGSNALLNEKDAVAFTKLREQAGLTNEELASMQKLTLATGGNLEDNVANMLHAAKVTGLNNGVLLNGKQIMQEVSKASAATKLSLALNPESLAKAAAQAKSLGMNLEQVNNIADKMLEIESSISNELEAELLTGKNLNLEQARLYALNNDMEGLSKEIAKNFGSAADFSQMNRIQQEAAAKAVGMSREELAATLTDQEALKGLQGDQAEKAKAALAAARERGMSEEEIKKQTVNGLMQQQSIQEKLVQTMDKLKEVFVSLLAPLMPVFDLLTIMLKPIGMIAGFIGSISGGLGVTAKWLAIIIGGFNTLRFLSDSVYRTTMLSNLAKKIGLITDNQAIAAQKASSILAKGTLLTQNQSSLVSKKTLGTVIAKNIQEKLALGWQYTRNTLEVGYNAVKKVGIALSNSSLMKSIGIAAMGAISSLSSIPIVGWALGLAAAGTAVALGYKFMKGNDVMSQGGYGKRTLMGPEGAIALNDKDTVIAGTNLFDKKGDKTSGTGDIKTSSNVDMSAVVAELQSVKAVLNQILVKEGHVYMDSTKVGTAANIGTSKIQ